MNKYSIPLKKPYLKEEKKKTREAKLALLFLPKANNYSISFGDLTPKGLVPQRGKTTITLPPIIPPYSGNAKSRTIGPEKTYTATIKINKKGYSKLSEIKLITIGLASAEKIRQWAEKTLPNGKVLGQVTNANTLHHKTFKPQKGGLFCERIFGPLKDFQCACGTVVSSVQQDKSTKKSKVNINNKVRRFCKKCNVEYTWSVIRRYQLGYIQLVSPVTHIWYLKGNPSYLSILLDIKKRHLELVAYCTDSLTLENYIKGNQFSPTKIPSEMLLAWELTVQKNGAFFSKGPQQKLNYSIEQNNYLSKKQKRLTITKKSRSLPLAMDVYYDSVNMYNTNTESIQFNKFPDLYTKKGVGSKKEDTLLEMLSSPRGDKTAVGFYSIFIQTHKYLRNHNHSGIPNKVSQLPARKKLLKTVPTTMYLFLNLQLLFQKQFFTDIQNLLWKKIYFTAFQESISKFFCLYGSKNITIPENPFYLSYLSLSLKGEANIKGDKTNSNMRHLTLEISKQLNELTTNKKLKNIVLSNTTLLNNNTNYSVTPLGGMPIKTKNNKKASPRDKKVNINKEGIVLIEMVKLKWFNLIYKLVKKYYQVLLLLPLDKSIYDTHLFIPLNGDKLTNYNYFNKNRQSHIFPFWDYINKDLSVLTPKFKDILVEILFTILVNKKNTFTSTIKSKEGINKKYNYNTQILHPKSFSGEYYCNLHFSFTYPISPLGNYHPKGDNKATKGRENYITHSSWSTRFVLPLSLSSSIKINTIKKKASGSSKLVNNIYTVSHRERWADDEWQKFNEYMSAPKNLYLPVENNTIGSKDLLIIPNYNNRIFNYPPYQPNGIQQNLTKNLSPKKNEILKDYPLWDDPLMVKNTYFNINNSAFYSGPGIIQQLLNELDFSELQKIDKQNRILLYQLNKYIYLLKKRIYNKKAKKELKDCYKQRDQLIRRTKLIRTFFRKDSKPTSMVLTVLPVLPPDLRPIVKIGGQIAASDLNRLYQRVIYRNDRLKKFLKERSLSNSYEMKYAQRLLQEAVDNLIQNGKSGSGSEKDARGRALKSLSDLLKGKQGRFRQYLLGKRVDYSGRSVIVVGPKLKLHECGLPKEMALELYLPFLLKRLINHNYARTVIGAKNLIKKDPDLIWELLKEIMQTCPVLLNRAPTLHRLGIQAFQPKLIEGRAILLHPLVCPAFNADFDGDQMAVHVPITIEARAEAWKLMSARQNFLSPATGEPLAIPSQDMVLGCYYLTTHGNKPTIKNMKGTGLSFDNFSDVLNAYRRQIIDLHAMVWVKFNGVLEQGNDQDEPIEIRIYSHGNWNEIYKYIQNNYVVSGSILTNYNKITQYICTTPGRILFNYAMH